MLVKRFFALCDSFTLADEYSTRGQHFVYSDQVIVESSEVIDPVQIDKNMSAF
jgi:hypothetical protein